MARRSTPCVFCGLTNAATATRCAGCGGPLQAPVGADPGPPPPAVPRAIARRWVWQEVFQFPVVWGVLFGGIPTGIGCVFVVVGLFTLLIPFLVIGPLVALVFGGIGGTVALWGLWSGWKGLALLRSGAPAVARVVGVSMDPTVRRDGVCPWVVQYVFDIDGRTVGGVATYFDAAASTFAEGDRLHVVYDPADPTRNVPWPPPS